VADFGKNRSRSAGAATSHENRAGEASARLPSTRDRRLTSDTARRVGAPVG
jgi:hypothetical protein